MASYHLTYRTGRRDKRSLAEDAMCAAARALAKEGTTSLSAACIALHIRKAGDAARQRTVSKTAQAPTLNIILADGCCTIELGARTVHHPPAGYLDITAA